MKVAMHSVLFKLSGLLHLPVEYVYFAVYMLTIYAFLTASYLILFQLGVKRQSIEAALILLVPFSILYPSVSHFHIIVKRLVPYLFVTPVYACGPFTILSRKIPWQHRALHQLPLSSISRLV
ncbi:MAG: hypothetical protein DSZ23_01405 [Thermodesulfatator sp.]|nr:MAG: hypothetical protein DSZ23_01405 [Thermodesulfatator sp.]